MPLPIVNLIYRYLSGVHIAPLTVTWINHHSFLMMENKENYSKIDVLGVDGLLMRYLNFPISPVRSSADLVLPALFESNQLKVGLIGGSHSDSRKHADFFTLRYPTCTVTWSYSGYLGVSDLIDAVIKEKSTPDVIVIGMGSPLQEICAIQLAQRIDKKCLIVTCGGWLDQIGYEAYYPKFAYPLKINWLIRLIREPRRLWRRYSIEVISTVLNIIHVRSFFQRHREKLI